MRIAAVFANTADNSRAAKVARQVIAGAEAAGHEVVIYDLTNMPLLGCVNCRVCRKTNSNCVRRDGLKAYFDDLENCGAVLVTAPNYNSQPSGSMITFLNRHYCLLDADKQPRLGHDLKLISVFAQGAPENYGKYDSNYAWYLSCFKTKRLVAEAPIIVGGDSNLAEDGDIMKKAFAMGQAL